jgi:hypothetical protein
LKRGQHCANLSVAVDLFQFFLLEHLIADHFEVETVRVLTGEPFEVVSVHPSQIFVLVLCAGKLPEPEHAELNNFSQFELGDFPDELVHESAVLVG